MLIALVTIIDINGVNDMKLRIMESVNLDDGYEEVSSRDGYRIYRKTLRDDNGKIIKGIWAAQDWDGKDEPFEITYDQARGFEPINPRLGNLQKKVSKALGFGRYRDIEESMDSERIVARSFDELIEKLQELGYHTGAYNSDHIPSDNWLYIGKNHKEYEAEFTKYKDGRYEMMLYNINPTGEDYDLDIDEGCHKKSSKNKKRKVVKEDLYHDAQKEVYDFFRKKQWDLNIPEVANYAEGVVELLELDPEFADGTYTMRDWYKDTQINYPEDIEWLDSTAY